MQNPDEKSIVSVSQFAVDFPWGVENLIVEAMEVGQSSV